MSDPEPEMVMTRGQVRNGGSSRIYHTDEDCRHIRDLPDDRVHTHPLDSLTDDWRECKACAGVAETGGGPHDIHDTLAKAEPGVELR